MASIARWQLAWSSFFLIRRLLTVRQTEYSQTD
jgi:hypothetical protein